MCTLTLMRAKCDQFILTMNRDESADRVEARPRYWPDYKKVYAPRDTESHGTWIGTNKKQAVACMLNRYDPHTNEHPRPSRGMIVPNILNTDNNNDSIQYLVDELDPTPFAPFTILLYVPGAITIYHWDGKNISWEQTDDSLRKPIMLTSSSWNAEKVVSWRKALFEHWLDSDAPFRETVPAFHLESVQGYEGWGPFVRRGNIRTNSITQIDLSLSKKNMAYWTYENLISVKTDSPWYYTV